MIFNNGLFTSTAPIRIENMHPWQTRFPITISAKSNPSVLEFKNMFTRKRLPLNRCLQNLLCNAETLTYQKITLQLANLSGGEQILGTANFQKWQSFHDEIRDNVPKRCLPEMRGWFKFFCFRESLGFFNFIEIIYEEEFVVLQACYRGNQVNLAWNKAWLGPQYIYCFNEQG